MASEGEDGAKPKVKAEEDAYDVPGSAEVQDRIQGEIKDIIGRRRQVKSSMTRAMNRVKQAIQNDDMNQKRLYKEMDEIRKFYRTACELHVGLYDLTQDSEHKRLDRWENDIANQLFSFEEEIEATDIRRPEHPAPPPEAPSPPIRPTTTTSRGYDHRRPSQSDPDCEFDSWINELTEFQETNFQRDDTVMSIAEALYKLEASRDMPTVLLKTFDGNPLCYVDFIDTFRIHVHEKRHLNDDVRMVQFRSHLSGEAEKVVTGLGTSGIMYATALKMLKQSFGHPSVIARAHINKLTKGPKIQANNRQGLRDLSLDVVNCIATLQKLNYFADANATDTLRQIVRRFPDHLITKWKTVVPDIREEGRAPTLDDVNLFLRKFVRSMFDPDFGDIETGRKFDAAKVGHRSGVHSAQPQGMSTQGRKPMKCHVCEENHRITNCPTFQDSSVLERNQIVKEKRLCFSCLNKGHSIKECRSKKRCDKNGCTRMHHILLHIDPPSASSMSSMTSATSNLDKNGLLPVVRAFFRAPNGRMREGNVLIDSGAGTTIIRKSFAQALGLQGKRESLQISVVGGEKVDQKDSRRVNVWISSMSGGEEFQIEAHEIDKTVISVSPLNRPWLSSFAHLADLQFSHKAGPVDLILGVQYSHLHVEEDVRQGLPFDPVAKQTPLGWYVIGPDNSGSKIPSVNFVQKIDLESFYDVETMGVRAPSCTCPKKVMSPDDKVAMNMFESSCHRQDGRFVIGLPWKKDPKLLPNNYALAEKRLTSLEKSLLRTPEKAKMYNDAVNEYLQKEWAVRLTIEELQAKVKPLYYLPHHGVYRPDKPSTPLRVVFDPACLFQGVSLNSFLHKGPCLIGELLGILLRFREDPIAFVGDISKMFLQVLLTEEDSQVHRFLWRNLDATIAPIIYRLTRVTFGDKPSPDMASFVMLKLAEEFQVSHPEAAAILQRDRYMDDLIHSCKTTQEAHDRMDGLDTILASGSFKIKEWFCSSKAAIPGSQPEEIQTLPVVSENEHELKPMPDINSEQVETIKTLGVCWNPGSDTIHFQVKIVETETLSKRKVLSKLSMLYDPLGLAAVVTVKAKIAMQAIWRLDLAWDDPLPEDLHRLWHSLFEEMKLLETVQFPRCLRPNVTLGTSELHVFADASSLAYGAVSYILWHTTKGPSIRLVASKVRVAPLKQTTVPRLELMAALIASRLAKTIYGELREKPSVTLWSDSQIVLHWVHSESITLKAFVGVRVAEIQSTWDASHWKFVPTKENPADDLSRGLSAEDVTGRWMHGPSFLYKPTEEWPNQLLIPEPQEDPERKCQKPVYATVKIHPPIDCHAFSSFQRLLRVTAYCFRFIHNMQSKVKDPSTMKSDCLQPEELEKAETYWILQAQQGISDISTRYRDLTPFIENGIIKVGGRLHRSTLSYEQAHPILLPASNYISMLIARDIHQKMGHPGSERTLCESRRKYWIVRGRNLVRDLVRRCTVCRKFRQPAHATLMSDLPPERLMLFSPPFTTTGVDLFGPFNLKYGRNKSTKAWGALFTCATVRAIHLEIVDGLSTQAFLQSLRRFVSHHGWPSTIISDNGTSFVGAQGELRKLVQEGRKQIQDYAMLHKVKWIFITPLSPHQGGFYESMIKLTKRALQVAIGQQLLTWNEMATVFAEIQCLVNSRPLSYSSNDPNDPQPLTPNHFLIGRASTDIPQGPFQETKNLHKRFEFVQALVNQFWRRFVREYLPTLNQRSKWRVKGRQLQVGDIVILKDPNVPRGKWELARVMTVYPGIDNIVRNVEVKTKRGTYQRSVQRCCLILES